MDNLVDYNGWADVEMYGLGADRPPSPYVGMSHTEKLKLVKAIGDNDAHKIIVGDIHILAYRGGAAGLINHLASRSDLYYLERRNIRAAVVSKLIAVINLNFHQHNNLTASRVVTYSEVFDAYMHAGINDKWVKQAFDFKETFVYEDLLGGGTPKTLRWDRNKSLRAVRNSTHLSKCIVNYDRVVGWMDDLGIEGQI